MCHGHTDFSVGHCSAQYAEKLCPCVPTSDTWQGFSQSVTLTCATNDSSRNTDGWRGDDAVSIAVLQPGVHHRCSRRVTPLCQHPSCCHTASFLSRWPIQSSCKLLWEIIFFIIIIIICNAGKQYCDQKISPTWLCCQTPLPRAVFEEYIGSNWIF